MIVFGLVGGPAYPVLVWLVCGCKPRGILLWLGITLIMLTLLLAVRLLAFKYQLLLDAFTVPCGPLRVRTVRILYTNIERVWEIRRPMRTSALGHAHTL